METRARNRRYLAGHTTMKLKVDFNRLTPATELSGEDPEDQALLEQMAVQARSYVESFKWCKEVVDCFIGDLAVGGVVAVFLVKIVPARRKVDEWLWTVVGDLPPAYFPADEAPTPVAVLSFYIQEMQLWIDAVLANRPIEDLILVETSDGAPLEPSRELAQMLESRLRFLEREIVPKYT
jgi:hypothetical protein